MTVGRRCSKATFAATWRQYAATTLVDLVAESPDGATCASKVVPLASGTFTELRDGDGSDRPITTALPAGYQHHGEVSKANCSVAFLAYWDPLGR